MSKTDYFVFKLDLSSESHVQNLFLLDLEDVAPLFYFQSCSENLWKLLVFFSF